MIKLETTFVSGEGGFSTSPGPLTYKQLARTDSVAVYQRFYADGRPKDFETFIIKVDPKGKEQKFPGGVVKVVEDDTEKYPSASQFGRIAWSFHNEGAAMDRFERLCKQADVAEAEENEPSEPAKAITVPIGEFSTKELAEANGIEYPVAFLWIKTALGETPPKIQFLREERRAAKGKPSKIYAAVKTT